MKAPIFKYYDPFNDWESNTSNNYPSISFFFKDYEASIRGRNEPKLMQAIDRKDKAGAELFSGDIIRIDISDTIGIAYHGTDETREGHRIGVIRYQPSKGFIISRAIQFWDDENEYKKVRGAFEFSTCNCLKVGNIHSDAAIYESIIYGIKCRNKELKAGGEA